MSALAAQFGPALLVATLAAPLVVLAAFLMPRLRGLARSITPLAAAPALAASVLAIGGAPFGADLPALRVSLWLDQPGGHVLLAAALVWLIVSIFALSDRAGGRTPTVLPSPGCSRWPAVSACSSPLTF